MTDDTSTRRPTRRSLATQPFPREIGAPTRGRQIRFNPINPAELADIIDRARKQRTEEDIKTYAARKRTT